MNEKYEAALKQAKKYKDMADKILLGRFREKYYLLAIKELEKPGEAEKAEENLLQHDQDEEAAALKKELELLLNEARARMVIEKYDFACKSREYARISEDMGSAALHFKEAAEARKQIPVVAELLSEETRRAYDETAHAQEDAVKCEKKSTITYQASRLRMLLGLAAAAVLAVGIFSISHTATFRMYLGRAEMAIGMYTEASENFQLAYKRGHKEVEYLLLLNALYQDGKKDFEDGEYRSAAEKLHLPAMNEMEDADRLCVEAELHEIRLASAGSKVLWAGCEWKILDQQEQECLMIKAEPVRAGAFDSAGNTNWEASELHNYLNGEFLDFSFSPMEKAHLGEEAPVTLLTAEEYEAYRSWIGKSSQACWLRSQGKEEGLMQFTDINNNIMEYGYPVVEESLYASPVIRIEL